MLNMIRSKRFSWGTVLAISIVVLVLTIDTLFSSNSEHPGDDKPNKNSHCLVCHLDLKNELITTVHHDKDITCEDCHGASQNHIHDEMLMTKPDILFGRSEVCQKCSQCHHPKNNGGMYTANDHKNPAQFEAFHKKWLGRVRPNGRVITQKPICTDCHGTHNIVKNTITPADKKSTYDWIPLFNGRDLSGWTTQSKAVWTVKTGRLMAQPANLSAPADLWTQGIYEDYLLTVTFRADWPVRAGIWMRKLHDQTGPRLEIAQHQDPPAFPGSVSVNNQFILLNLRNDLFDPQGWNTLSGEARGNRYTLWLNGEEIGAVRYGQATHGHIGLHIEGTPENKAARLTISEILLQRLPKSEKADPGLNMDSLSFQPLFNGKDLSGWKPTGQADWRVINGELVGTQGKNFAPGDLFTEASYQDFVLRATYRVEWPCNTGLWFRYQSPAKAYQADILEYKNPEAYSGTIYCPGKMFIATNTDKHIVNRAGWNTLVVRAEGEHLQVWLNGHQVADVFDKTCDSGRIGFQVHPGKEFGPMKIVLREAMIAHLKNH